MSRPALRVVPAPPYVAPAVRQRLAHLLPPRGMGVDALSDLAAELRTLQAGGQIDAAGAHLLLLEAYLASGNLLRRIAMAEARGLRAEAAEEVVAELGTRLERVYATWPGQGRFGSYLYKSLVRDAVRALRKERGLDDESPELLAGPDLDEDPSLRVQALRRFVWYCYGSPDNGKRLSYDKASLDFLAYAARLERRPVQELVQWNQPRTGEWGAGDGEQDRKWWRGRAEQGKKTISEALKRPDLKRAHDRILAALGGGR